MDDSLRPLPLHGALRSRMVAKLTGVPMRTIEHWHETALLRAHVIPGARGIPRLYSWVDYRKLRAAKKLLDQGVPTKDLRSALDALERVVPNWYTMPMYGYGRRVLVPRQDTLVTVGEAEQLSFPFLRGLLDDLHDEGPLGEMRCFSDVVEMHPDVVSGNPVVLGTRLETIFLAQLAARGVDIDRIAAGHRLAPNQVKRAIAFEKAVA